MNLIAQHRMLVGQKIMAARKFAGLSQDGLAAKIDSSRQQIIRLEKGRHTPTARTLQKIAAATGLEVEFFDVSGDDDGATSKADDEEPGPQMTLDDFMRIRARQILHEEREAAAAEIREGVL